MEAKRIKISGSGIVINKEGEIKTENEPIPDSNTESDSNKSQK